MAKRINPDLCAQCGACITECPNEAISESDITTVIDPNLCTECAGIAGGPQCVAVCPTDAIEDDPDHPA